MRTLSPARVAGALAGLLVAAGIALYLIPSSDYLLLPDRAHPVAPLVHVQGGRAPAKREERARNATDKPDAPTRPHVEERSDDLRGDGSAAPPNIAIDLYLRGLYLWFSIAWVVGLILGCAALELFKLAKGSLYHSEPA